MLQVVNHKPLSLLGFMANPGDVLDSTGMYFIIWQAKYDNLIHFLVVKQSKYLTGKIKNAFAQAFDFSMNPAILGVTA